MDRMPLVLAAAALAACCCLPRDARGQGAATTAKSACRLDGTWELVSVTVDGKDEPMGGYHQRKMVSGRRYMWLGQAGRRDTLPMRTAMDSLRATSMAGGAGTFTLAGNTYTERLEYFPDASLLGRDVRATCRIEGDRWYHSFTFPFDTTRSSAPPQRVVEVWRRLP